MAALGWLNPTICTRVNGLTLTKRLRGASFPVAASRRGESQWGQHLHWRWLEPRLPIRPLPRPVSKTANRELTALGAAAAIHSGPSRGQLPTPLQRPPPWTA
jgi:hypothetical protein